MANVLKASWFLPAPVTMAAALDSVIVLPNIAWPIPDWQNYGAQIPRSEMLAMLDAWIADFTAAKLILWKGAPLLGPSFAYGDLIQPTGDWYAAKVAVLGAVHDGSGGTLYVGAGSLQWDYSGADPSETITGASLIDVTV